MDVAVRTEGCFVSLLVGLLRTGNKKLARTTRGLYQPSDRGLAGGTKAVTSAEEPWGFTKREGFQAVRSFVNGLSGGDVVWLSALCSASSSRAFVGNHVAISEPVASLLARGI